MAPRITIVGGGITGLAAAYRLQNLSQKSPLDIRLYEASDRAGGTLQSTRRDGFLLEGGPDCFISDKPRGVDLCRELGLESELIGTRTENRRSFIVRNGQLYPIPEGFYLIGPSKLRPFLESPILSWKGKLRALAEPLISKRKDRNLVPDESLASFVRRRLGTEMLERMAQPLSGGIYAADPERLSLHATFPKFLEMEEKYGSVLLGLKKSQGEATAVHEASGARYRLFITLKNGMGTLPQALLKKLSPSALHLNSSIQVIRRTTEGRWQVILASGEVRDTDALCLALPAYASAALLRPIHRRLADLLESIPYTDSATLNMAFAPGTVQHPLNGFGYVCPHREARPAMACTFVQQKFEGRAPANHILLRAFMGGALQTDLLSKGDADLTREVMEDVKSLLGIQEPPLFTTLQRWKKAMPQYTVGHVQRILQIQETLAELPGLQLAGNWQRGVGIPDCIENGEWAAEQLVLGLESLQHLAHR